LPLYARCITAPRNALDDEQRVALLDVGYDVR